VKQVQIDQMIQNVTASVASEWNAVNSAFSDRIAEYIDARNKIQAHLAKVLRTLCPSKKWPQKEIFIIQHKVKFNHFCGNFIHNNNE